MQLPRSLRARLLIANLIVAGAALGTVAVAVSLVGPGYFAQALSLIHISEPTRPY